MVASSVHLIICLSFLLESALQLICEDGKRSGRCSGGNEEDEEEGECKDQGLSRPPVSSPTYWIGGFGLDWEAKLKEEDRTPPVCKDVFTVTLTFNDAFDCNPGKYGLLVICGIAGPYDVYHEWEIEIDCPVPCPPTNKPTQRPTKRPTLKPTKQPTPPPSPPSPSTSSSSSTSSTSSTVSSSGATSYNYENYNMFP